MAEENKTAQLKKIYISLEDKLKILNRLRDGEKVSSISKSLNMRKSSILTIKKYEAKIRKSIIEGSSISAKLVTRVKDINILRMEKALMHWFYDCRNKNIPLNGKTIQHKALQIYQHLKQIYPSPAEQGNNKSFVASDGWLHNLKKRFDLHNIRIQGEQGSADIEEIFQKKILTTEQLLEALDESSLTSNPSMLSMNDERSSIDLDAIKKAMDYLEQAQLLLHEGDNSIVRSEMIVTKIQKSVLPYLELLAEVRSNNTSVSTTNVISPINHDEIIRCNDTTPCHSKKE